MTTQDADAMTPDELRTAGEALYGPRWQCQLARTLGVNDRSVRRWLTGELVVPVAVALAIRGLLALRNYDAARSARRAS